MAAKHTIRKKTPMIHGVIFGTVSELIVTLVFCLITAWMINIETLTLEKSSYLVIISLLLSSFLGTYITKQISGEGKLKTCLICASAFYIVHILITALFFDGNYKALPETGLIILCGSFLFLLTRKNNRRGKRHRKIKTANR